MRSKLPVKVKINQNYNQYNLEIINKFFQLAIVKSINKYKMNKSFQMNNKSVSHYLPKINKISQSSNLSRPKAGLNTDRYRAQSTSQINTNVPLTRKLVNMEDIRNVDQYDVMNQKQLLRQHQKLLRIIKKFQEIIDIHLSRKKRQIRSHSISSNKPSSTKQDLLKCQIVNNKKIIQNYQKQIKQLQSVKKQRKLNDIIQEKIQVQNQISQLKKDIFNLKNDDNMAGRSLVQNRPQIQRQLKQIEKDLKIQLTKKHEYIKKVQDLTEQLNNLKKQCQGINMNQISNQKSNNNNILMKISLKKAQLQQVRKQRQQIQQTIQDNMVSKAKRNKAMRKDIQNCQKRMLQMNNKIMQYKEKINRYQKAMDIIPKTADQKNNHEKNANVQNVINDKKQQTNSQKVNNQKNG